MKNSKILTILITTLMIGNNIQADSCCPKEKKVSHHNRKMRTCCPFTKSKKMNYNRNTRHCKENSKTSCGAKNVRMNRFAKKKCSPCE